MIVYMCSYLKLKTLARRDSQPISVASECLYLYVPGLVGPSPASSSPEVQTRHDHGSELDHAASIAAGVSLDHEVDGQAQLALRCPAHVRLAELALHHLRIVRHHGDIVPSVHQLPHLAGTTVDVLAKDLHHVFFGVGGLCGPCPGGVGAVAVEGDVEGLIVVEDFDDVGGWGRVDDG